MKKTSLCFAAVFAVLFGFFVASCSSSADSPNLALFTQSSGGGSSGSGGGTQTTPTPTPTPPAEYNVTYVITNGSDDMTGESRSSGKYTAQSELAIPQKEGFVFKGWYQVTRQLPIQGLVFRPRANASGRKLCGADRRRNFVRPLGGNALHGCD